MSTVADPLPDDVEALQAEVERARRENDALKKQLAWYEEQHRLAQAKRFAASTDTPPERKRHSTRTLMCG